MTDTSNETATKTTPSVLEEPLQASSGSIASPHTAPAGFLDRTLRGAWQAIAGVARGKSTEIRPDLPDADLGRLKLQILECLEVRGGEVSARARAAALGQTYLSLNPQGRRRFLNVLASEITARAGADREGHQRDSKQAAQPAVPPACGTGPSELPCARPG